MQNFLTNKNIFLFLISLVHYVWAEERISQKKCREYANFVNSVEESPLLSLRIETNVVSECGIIETPLIIGGEEAKSKEFPHMVAIGYGTPNDADISWQCGGSIISENYILTASHCLESKDKGPATRVRAGSTSLDNPEPDYQERDVAEGISHPNRTWPARYHDIALLRLSEPFDLNPAVRPACLEEDNELHGDSAIASGFGKVSFDDEDGSNKLMKVTLNYISEEDCKKSYKSDLGSRQLSKGLIPHMLCAGVMEGGKDTCQGDSGGPLQRVLSDPYCMYSLVGITSFGKFCAFAISPAIYTRVSFYLDWIESVVWPDN